MDNRIDLNEAGVEELAALPGIGAKLAERIVTYRETVHPFAEIIELAAVPGISERMVRQIEQHLSVSAEPEQETTANVDEQIVEEPRIVELAIPEVLDAIPAATDSTPDLVAADGDSRPEAVTVTAPPPEPDVPHAAPSVAVTAARSGLREHFFTAVVGAVLGTLLTLAVLWALNGSLRLNETSQLTALDQRSGQAVASVQAEQIAVLTEVQTLRENLTTSATRIGESETGLASLRTALATTQDLVADTEESVVALEETTADLEDRMETVAGSAEKLEAFMDGLRDLLLTLQGTPPAPPATATMPATTVVTVTSTATAVATLSSTPPVTASPTALPTRTPRPTATPLGTTAPTATPAE